MKRKPVDLSKSQGPRDAVGERPVEQKVPSLNRMPSTKAEYWRMAAGVVIMLVVLSWNRW